MKIIFQILGLVLVSGLALVFIVLTLGPIFLDLNKGKAAKKEREEKWFKRGQDFYLAFSFGKFL